MTTSVRSPSNLMNPDGDRSLSEAPVGVVYGPELLRYDFGGAHPLAQVRLTLTSSLIRAVVDDTRNVRMLAPVAGMEDQALIFHTMRYLHQVREAEERGKYLDTGDTPSFPGCVEASLWFVGSTIDLIDKVMAGELRRAFLVGGGFHHAGPQRASGFCILNDCAIAVGHLQRSHGLERILYVDIDGHHGDGVMYGFYDDDRVLDVDFHEDGRYLFPGTGHEDENGTDAGQGLKVNVPCPPGTGDEEYLSAWEAIGVPVIERFRPQFILLQAGADSHAGDPLTHMGLTTNSYDRITRSLASLADRYCDGRMVAFGGGGYNIGNVVMCWTTVVCALARLAQPDETPAAWREEFAASTGQSAPTTVREDRTAGAWAEGLDATVAKVATRMGLDG